MYGRRRTTRTTARKARRRESSVHAGPRRRGGRSLGRLLGRRGNEGELFPPAGEPVISSSPPTPGRPPSTVTRGLVLGSAAESRVPRGRSSRNRSRGPITRTSSLPGRLASHCEHGIWHRSAHPSAPLANPAPGPAYTLHHGDRTETAE